MHPFRTNNCGELRLKDVGKKVRISGWVHSKRDHGGLLFLDVRDHFGETVYKTTIPRNVKVSEAPSHGKPAILYDVNSTGSMAYIRLAREIINKQGSL